MNPSNNSIVDTDHAHLPTSSTHPTSAKSEPMSNDEDSDSDGTFEDDDDDPMINNVNGLNDDLAVQLASAG